MNTSPLFSFGMILVILGILIFAFPHVLQLIVALALIFFGLSLIGLDRSRKKTAFQFRGFNKNAKHSNKKVN